VTVRFGLVGASHWARTVHARALASTPGADLVGVWSRTADNAKSVAKDFSITSFSEFEEMLENVDAVSIAVSPEAQPQLAMRAAAARKALLLEKPLASDVGAAESVAAAIAKSCVPSIVFFMRRFVREIEDAVSNAKTRSWTHAQVSIHSDAMASDSPYLGSIWRQQPHAELWDIGPHVFSMLLPILGAVSSVSARFEGRRTVLETTHINGAKSNISLSLRALPNEKVREYRFQNGDQKLVLPEPIFSTQEAFARAAEDLIGLHLNGKTSHFCDAAFGLAISRILAGAEKSARTGGGTVQLG
jgi:predicted dehydrogenase